MYNELNEKKKKNIFAYQLSIPAQLRYLYKSHNNIK